MRDERALLGFLLLHLLVAVPGAALLAAMGLLRVSPRGLLAAAGPAFLTGLVVAGLPVVLLLIAGVTVGGPLSLAVWAVVTAGLVVLALRRRSTAAIPRRDAPPARGERLLHVAILAALVPYFAYGCLAFAHLPIMWDDANIWSLKGFTLYHHASLVPEVFRNPDFSSVHVDYPLLHAVAQASFFRGIGEVDARLWHMEIWLLFAAAVWTLAWLLAPLARRWVWSIVIALLALSSVIFLNVTLGNADALMAALTGCGALCFGIWLHHGRSAHAILGGLFLAAAANVKNEGLAFGVAIILALLVATLLGAPRGRRRDAALGAGIFAVLVAPWQLWVALNDAAVRATRSPWSIVSDPDFFVDRLDLLWRGVQQVMAQLLTMSAWGLLLPAFLLVAIVLLRRGAERTVAGFYLGAWLLAWLAVAYTYWVTPIADIVAFEQRTGPRIVLGVGFVAAAGLAHLLAVAATVARPEAAEAEREPPPPVAVTAGAPAP